jgi:hypothetical protein
VNRSVNLSNRTKVRLREANDDSSLDVEGFGSSPVVRRRREERRSALEGSPIAPAKDEEAE